MPLMFVLWSVLDAGTVWAISEIMFGLMAWFNVGTLVFLLPTVKKVYDDYMEQRKAGVKEPYFNPEKLGIKGCGLWMQINAEQIKKEQKV